MTNPIVAEDAIKTPPAGELPVEKATVVLTTEELDALTKAAEEATALAEKYKSDSENYQRGMLKAKGKLKDNGIDEEDAPEPLTAEKIVEIVKETIKTVQPAPVQAEDELALAKRKISELKIALAAKPGTAAPSSMGTNLDKPEVIVKTFSPEQEADLRKRAIASGADPEEFIKQVAKNWQNPLPGVPPASDK